MDSNGQLNEESSNRALKGIELYFSTKAKFIVTCGWAYRSDSAITIADAFFEFIKTNSIIHKDKIFLEKGSRDTVGDAYFTKANLAIPNSWKNIYVVTSDYHVPRAQEIFNFIYGLNYSIKVVGAKTPNPINKLASEKASLKAFRLTFREIKAGDTSGIGNCIREKHPFYNGNIYAKI